MDAAAAPQILALPYGVRLDAQGCSVLSGTFATVGFLPDLRVADGAILDTACKAPLPYSAIEPAAGCRAAYRNRRERDGGEGDVLTKRRFSGLMAGFAALARVRQGLTPIS